MASRSPAQSSRVSAMLGFIVSIVFIANACGSKLPETTSARGSSEPADQSLSGPSIEGTAATAGRCVQRASERPEAPPSEARSIEIERATALAMSETGVRGLILVAGDNLRLIVDETFVEPQPGWAADLGVEVVVSCIPSRLIEIVEDTVGSATRADPTAFSSVGYNAFRDVVEASSTLDVNVLRRAIEERFGEPVPEGFVEIGRVIAGGPAVATSST